MGSWHCACLNKLTQLVFIYIWFSFRHVIIIQIRTEMVNNENYLFWWKAFCVCFISFMFILLHFQAVRITQSNLCVSKENPWEIKKKFKHMSYDCFCICVNGMYQSLMNIYNRKSLNWNLIEHILWYSQ